jgi:uncharacterized protein
MRRFNQLLIACIVTLCCFFAENTSAASQQADAATPDRSASRWWGAIMEPPLRVHVPGFRWDHEVRVALPLNYFKSKKAYPVLWVTDGSYTFDTVAQMADGYQKTHLSEIIVVAIGNPAGEEDDFQIRRLFDLSTMEPETDDEEAKTFWKGFIATLEKDGASVRFGGAAAFLNYIVDDLRPTLAKKYRMQDDHALFGYSMGGGFCEYALLQRTESFQRYLCGGGGFKSNLNLEKDYAVSHRDLRARLFFGFSESDAFGGGLIYSVYRNLERRKYPSLKVKKRIFPGTDHTTAIPSVITEGLLFIYGDIIPPS